MLAVASGEVAFNHHLRYVLPALPFAFVRASRIAAARWSGAWITAACGSIGCATASSLLAYPHGLSYFNEFAGGPANGRAHLLHSNVDWGQDFLFLRDWVRSHPEARPLWVGYYGGFEPREVGLDYPMPPFGEGFVAGDLQPGWYAVSVNLVGGMPWQGRPLGAYRYFDDLRPVARAAHSILIYRVDGETGSGG